MDTITKTDMSLIFMRVYLRKTRLLSLTIDVTMTNMLVFFLNVPQYGNVPQYPGYQDTYVFPTL